MVSTEDSCFPNVCEEHNHYATFVLLSWEMMMRPEIPRISYTIDQICGRDE